MSPTPYNSKRPVQLEPSLHVTTTSRKAHWKPKRSNEPEPVTLPEQQKPTHKRAAGVKVAALTTGFKRVEPASTGAAIAPRDSHKELPVREAAVKIINKPTLSRVRGMSVSSLSVCRAWIEGMR
jgi:peroxiredoxin